MKSIPIFYLCTALCAFTTIQAEEVEKREVGKEASPVNMDLAKDVAVSFEITPADLAAPHLEVAPVAVVETDRKSVV
jgi:hypothetical protein